MAYGIMKKLLAEAGIEDLDIRTGGVMTVPGLLPTQECRQLLIKDGIDISTHRSCQLTSELIKRASLILGMTSFHVQMALRMSDSARGKTFLLKEYAGSDTKNDQVQDPMGCTLEVYKKVYREIRAACKRLMKTEFVQPKPEPKAISAPAKAESAPAKKKAAKAAAKTKSPAPANSKKAATPAAAGKAASAAPKAKKADATKATPPSRTKASARIATAAPAKKPAAAKGAKK